MKTKALPFASVLTAIMLALIVTSLFTSCSKDDDEFDMHSPKLLIGSWVCEYPLDNFGIRTETEIYMFWKDGRGYYEKSTGITGNFSYAVNGGYLNINIWYSINHSQYMEHDSFNMGFRLEDENTLYLNSRKFTRVKDNNNSLF